MKKLSAFAAIAAMGIASAAQAGGPGPVIVEDAPVVVEDTGSSSSAGSLGGTGVLIALGLIALVAAVASSSDNS